MLKLKKSSLTRVLLCLGLSSSLSAFAKSSDLDERFFENYSFAVKAEKQSNTLQAVKLYKNAHEINKRDLGSLLKLGLLHFNSEAEGDIKKTSLELAAQYFEKAVKLKSADTLANTMLAKTYQELGDKDSAIKYFAKACNLEPDNILLKANLGSLYFEKKDFKSAIEIFNKVILDYPDNLSARSYLGASLQSTDNYLAAIEQYNYVLNFKPDQYSIVKNLADSWLALKQYSKAREYYEKAIVLDPNVPDVYADIAFVSRQEKDYGTAVDNYRKALELKTDENWKKALAYTLWDGSNVEDAIKVFDEIEDYKISAYLYQGLGDKGNAIASYKKAIEKDAQDHKSRYNLARLYHEGNDLVNAKLNYEKLLEQRPNDIEVLFLLATLRQEQGDVDIAVDSYEKLLEKQLAVDSKKESSSNSQLIKNNVHYNLGVAYKANQNLEKAEENFEQLLDEDAKDTGFTKTKDVYKQLSFIKIALSKDGEAEKLINDWLREDPTSIEARNLYADFLVHLDKERKAVEQLRLASVLDKTITTRLKLAHLLHSQNNLYDALAEYQNVLQKEPQNLNALLGAANNFKSLGFTNEAIGMYKRTLESHPDDVLANFNFGLLMQEKEKYTEAQKYYEKVLELDPDFIQTYYVLGLVYWNQDNKEKAEELWQEFKAKSADEALKQEIEKILSEASKTEILPG